MSGSLDVMAGAEEQSRGLSTPLPARRVRHELRDGLLVMVFSLVMSSLVAVVLILAIGAGGN